MKKRISHSNIIVKENVVSALLQLIYEKPISSISISELTARAGVSRMSFYRNYNSIEEIFEKELEDIFLKYEEDNQSININIGIYYDELHMEHCFSYFYNYRNFLEGLFRCGFGDIFLKKLTSYTYLKWHGKVSENESYKLVGFAGFVYNVYMLWAKEQYKDTVEEMAHYVSTVFSKAD